jgi:hypothetical protein
VHDPDRADQHDAEKHKDMTGHLLALPSACHSL